MVRTCPPDLPVTALRNAITNLLNAVAEKFGPTLRFEDDFY